MSLSTLACGADGDGVPLSPDATLQDEEIELRLLKLQGLDREASLNRSE